MKISASFEPRGDQSARRRLARDPRTRRSPFRRTEPTVDSALQPRLVKVMTPPLSGLRMSVVSRRREHPLPRPVPPSVRILPFESQGHLHPAGIVPEIPFVLTQPDAPAGRGRGLRPAPAKLTALRLGLPVIERIEDVPDEPTIVLVAYGRLIPPGRLDRHLWLNVHPSLLPR